MFSDIVVEHGSGDGMDHAANVNVCWNEKTTQTDYSESAGECHLLPGSNPSSPSSLNRKSSLKQPSRPVAEERLPSYSAPGPGSTSPVNGAGLTCQELLALSGALGAALPTPLALPSYPSASEEVPAAAASVTPAKHSNNNNQLAPPSVMPILPTLAMSLWPEPFQGKKTFALLSFFFISNRRETAKDEREKLLLSIFIAEFRV